VATYYTGCNPGRGDSPAFSQTAAALTDQFGDAVAFLASLKGGVNAEVCQAWAALPGTTAEQPLFLHDRDKALHYLFFENEHPAYVVLDHCMRVRAKLGASSFGTLTQNITNLVGALDEPCPEQQQQQQQEEEEPQEAVEYGGGECVAELGEARRVQTLADAGALGLSPAGLPLLATPTDLAFDPRTGEMLVTNNDTEAVTLLMGREAGEVRGITRRDTAFYHYMARVSSIAFDREGAAWATCQDSENTYDDHDSPNFFMGPTLYDGDENVTLITADGEACSGDRAGDPGRVCFLTHTDMLHESPLCTGIAHDPETRTVHGNVFWAVGARFDPTDPRYDGETQTLIRYDFEKPHGPGSLDHSLATVRRHHDVLLKRVAGVPSHAAVDPELRVLFVADTGAGRVLAVDVDSGRFEKHAREDVGGEFKLWSATEPAFEYSVYNCTRAMEFASGLDAPSGIALSRHHVFVGDFATGVVHVYEKATGREVQQLDSGSPGLKGLEIEGGRLYFVHSSEGVEGKVSYVEVTEPCADGASASGPPPPLEFPEPVCGTPEVTSLGVHITHTPHDCGYQNQTDMCLGERYGTSRENCRGQGPDAFNYDMLLMTGFRCHRCLPEPCMNGGSCENLWRQGYQCTCAGNFTGVNCQTVLEPDSEPQSKPESEPEVEGYSRDTSGGYRSPGEGSGQGRAGYGNAAHRSGAGLAGLLVGAGLLCLL